MPDEKELMACGHRVPASEQYLDSCIPCVRAAWTARDMPEAEQDEWIARYQRERKPLEYDTSLDPISPDFDPKRWEVR